MSKSTIIENNIPQELRSLKRWNIWRHERDNKKVPYDAVTGTHARPNDEKGCHSFEEAFEAYRDGKGDGINFLLCKDDPYAVVDLDCCLDDKGNLTPWAEDIVSRLNSYVEMSPSGHGLHIFVKLTDKQRVLENHTTTKNDGKIEYFTHCKYFTITGQIFQKQNRIETRQHEIEGLLVQYFPQGNSVDEMDLGPVPEDNEVRALINAANQVVPGISDLLFKEWPKESSEMIDRSALEYILARKLIEGGFTDLNTVAKIIFGSTIHQAKSAGRSPRASWKLAVSCAVHALAKNKETRDGNFSSQLEKPDLTFPMHSALGICADIARMFSDYFEAPFEYWFFTALTCLGSLASGKISLDSEEIEQPRLFTVILGSSADARKSSTIETIVKFFQEALGSNAPYIQDGAGSGEGLAEILQDHNNILLYFDELRVFVQKAKIENSILLPMVTSFFHRNSFSNTTKKRPLNIRDAHVSLISACTTETFESMWTPEFLDIGFPNRLWLVPGEVRKKVAFVEKIPEARKTQLKSRLKALFAQIEARSEEETIIPTGEESVTVKLPRPIVLRISEEAKTLLTEWYENKPIGLYGKRLDTYLKRLCILLAISDGNFEVITPEIMQAAISLVNWQFQVRKAYSPIDADNVTARLEQGIQRALLRAGGELPFGRLAKAVNASRTGFYLFKMALENLTEAEIIRKKSTGVRKGRKSEVYQLLSN